MNIRSIFSLRNPSERLVRAPLNPAFIFEIPFYEITHKIFGIDLISKIRNFFKAFLEPKAIITAPIHSGPNPHVMNEKLNVLVMYDKVFPVEIVRGIRNNCRLSSMIKRKVFCASDRIEKFSSRGFTEESLINQHIKNASTINPLNQHVTKFNRITYAA